MKKIKLCLNVSRYERLKLTENIGILFDFNKKWFGFKWLIDSKQIQHGEIINSEGYPVICDYFNRTFYNFTVYYKNRNDRTYFLTLHKTIVQVSARTPVCKRS